MKAFRLLILIFGKWALNKIPILPMIGFEVIIYQWPKLLGVVKLNLHIFVQLNGQSKDKMMSLRNCDLVCDFSI